jgi:hypothetical protein
MLYTAIFGIQVFSTLGFFRFCWFTVCPTKEGRLQNTIYRCPDPLDVPDLNNVCENQTVAVQVSLCEDAVKILDEDCFSNDKFWVIVFVVIFHLIPSVWCGLMYRYAREVHAYAVSRKLEEPPREDEDLEEEQSNLVANQTL